MTVLAIEQGLMNYLKRALLGNLRGNMVRFENDIETREQAERRIIGYSIGNINHSDCTSCMALSAAL